VWPDKSFASDVFPLFQSTGCADMACHTGARPAENLGLSSATSAYQALVNVAASQCGTRLRVKPGAPGSSYLINKLTGLDMCSGSKMPKGGAALSSAQMNVISAWIGSGAKP
jgi:hypothetical protein